MTHSVETPGLAETPNLNRLYGMWADYADNPPTHQPRHQKAGQ